MAASITPTWSLWLFGACLTIRLAVGVWVLSRTLRLRGFAELALGAFVVLLSLGEIAGVAAGRLRGDAGAMGVLPLSAVGLALVVGGHAALAFVTHRIFRPESGPARSAAWLASAVMLAAAAVRLVADSEPSVMADATPANLVLLVVRLATDLWWSVESVLYGRRVRRQAALGIGDALSARLFDLWATSAFGHAAILVLLLWCALILRVPASESPASLAIIGSAGLVSALAICASFRPPRFLVRGRRAVADTR